MCDEFFSGFCIEYWGIEALLARFFPKTDRKNPTRCKNRIKVLNGKRGLFLFFCLFWGSS
jgi:hypothetical protein